MIDRALIAIALTAHFLIAMSFVLTDGPGSSEVILTLTQSHGVHRSDLPILFLWLVGTAALATLWWRRSRDEN